METWTMFENEVKAENLNDQGSEFPREYLDPFS